VSNDTVFRSDEFGAAAKERLARATTVELPGPQVSGALYLGLNPDCIAGDFRPDLPSGSPQFYLRSVQTVNRHQVITRIVDLTELRGVSVPSKDCPGTREFKRVNDIARVIKAKADKLIKANKAAPGDQVYEVSLFEDAVISVCETAPVFVKVQCEFGVSAAEAAENVVNLIQTRQVCHCHHY
jgi:hypothetical protein